MPHFFRPCLPIVLILSFAGQAPIVYAALVADTAAPAAQQDVSAEQSAAAQFQQQMRVYTGEQRQSTCE